MGTIPHRPQIHRKNNRLYELYNRNKSPCTATHLTQRQNKRCFFFPKVPNLSHFQHTFPLIPRLTQTLFPVFSWFFLVLHPKALGPALKNQKNQTGDKEGRGNKSNPALGRGFPLPPLRHPISAHHTAGHPTSPDPPISAPQSLFTALFPWGYKLCTANEINCLFLFFRFFCAPRINT